ncbi:hypothetical protein FH972_015974 [Carpinus fangiana]|uniref:MYND-type domain-containing protein n=1 Tax=Carpinus fangiana TaxID=176857 RepID=A0A5N6RHV3_9ROSI|nr:hypothetical protein FH972_015974 [Carpinus fangiana]
MEDLQPALNEQGLNVSTVPEKGRCLLTTRDFYPGLSLSLLNVYVAIIYDSNFATWLKFLYIGEVIISQEPYVCVPNKSSVDSRCDGCFTSSNLKKCSACHVVCYCGSICQKLDWKLHRLECQALLRLDKDRRKSVTPSIRLMVKLYLRRKLQSEKVIPTTATDNYYLVEALVSHMSDIDEKQLVLYAQMANIVNFILQWPEINLKEIAENFSKFACNAHTICDSELRPLGTGLYPVISIINHSCLPNSVLLFEGRLAVIRAVQHIPQGDEDSRIHSRHGNFFSIQNDKGFICQQCGHVRDKEEITKIASELKLISDKVLMSSSSGNYQETVSMYQKIDKLQRKLCHPFSITLMQTREKLLKILMELQDWREALAYCRLTIPVYQRLYPGFHPLLGLQYCTCGKLEWLLGDTESAIKSLSKAVDILRVTHGTNTPFMKELVLKLEEARAEASYKLSSKDELQDLP